MALTFSRTAISGKAVTSRATLGAALTGLGCGCLFLATGAAGTSSEAMLKSSFSAAIASDPTVARVGKQLPVAGSEDFWLSAASADVAPGLSKAVSIGDSIDMTVGGTSKKLKVEAVSEVAPATTEIDTATDPQQLILVTARDAKDASAKPIRFIMHIPVAEPDVRDGENGRVL